MPEGDDGRFPLQQPEVIGGQTEKVRLRQMLWVVPLVLLAVVLYVAMGCPIRLWTGLGCPTCGMTRAIYLAALLRFEEAVYYHPLVWMVPVALWAIFAKTTARRPVLRKGLLIGVGATFLLVYIIRLFVLQHPVVMPQNGWIPQIVGQWLRRG